MCLDFYFFFNPCKVLLVANDPVSFELHDLGDALSGHLLTCCTELWYQIFLPDFLQEG